MMIHEIRVRLAPESHGDEEDRRCSPVGFGIREACDDLVANIWRDMESAERKREREREMFPVLLLSLSLSLSLSLFFGRKENEFRIKFHPRFRLAILVND